MAPKAPFKVHSLNKHVEETKNGLSAITSRITKTPATSTPKKVAVSAPTSSIFNNASSDSDDSSSSSDDDSDGDGADFLKNLTGRKPAAAAKASKNRNQDDEIADSDVERSAATDKSKPTKRDTAAPASDPKANGASSSDHASESQSDEEVSAKGAPLKSKISSTSATSPTSSSGSESGSGSDSSSSESSGEEDAESESESQAAGPAKQANQPESDSESASEEQTRTLANSNSKAVVNRETKSAESSESEEDSDSAKSGDESSSEDEASGDAQPNSANTTSASSDEEEADVSMRVDERVQPNQLGLPQFLPPDFQLRKSDQHSNGQDVARVCSEANLQGKQLWYFTLPANVPISVIEDLEFPMDKSQQNDRILSHNGQDYGISFDSTPPTKSIQILIPSADGSRYQPARRTVDQVLQLRRTTQLGATTATSAAVGSSSMQAIRPQPKGLKARFQPIGVTSAMGTIGPDDDGDDADDDNDDDDDDADNADNAAGNAANDADIEMQEAPAAPPPKLPKASRNKSNKSKDADADAADDNNIRTQVPAASVPKPPKASHKKSTKPKDAEEPKESSKSKKGKRKHSISEDEAAAAAEQLIEESVSAESKSKKQKTGAPRGSPDLGSEPQLPPLKQTLVVPPEVRPASSLTAKVSSTPVKKTKGSSKAAPSSTPMPPGSQVSGSGKKAISTPFPPSSQVSSASRKETPVPVPFIPSLAKPATPAGTPTAEKKSKKDKKRATASASTPN